jgi:hypothetical protein
MQRSQHLYTALIEKRLQAHQRDRCCSVCAAAAAMVVELLLCIGGQLVGAKVEGEGGSSRADYALQRRQAAAFVRVRKRCGMMRRMCGKHLFPMRFQERSIVCRER